MNLKKILLGTLVAAVSVVSLAPTTNAALNDAEFTSALNWAYENGLTKFNTEDAFNPYGLITREQLAKFVASFAVTNLCLEADETASCSFSDIPADPSLEQYVLLACQLGLVKGSNGKFMPTNNAMKYELLTIMSRALSAAAEETAPSEDMTPWYKGHFEAMKAAGITKAADVSAVTSAVTRYEALLMLYRARDEEAACADTDITSLLEDLFGDDTTATGTDTTDEVVTESNGTAMAKLSATTPNGATIPGLVSVKVASFEVSATSEDVVLTELVLKRMGLGSDDTVDEVTAFVNGDVVTKSKSFNSDDEAVLTMNPAVTVKAGTTVVVDIVAKVGDSATVSNEEFSVALVAFDTNGKEETANLPLNANTFRIGGINGAEVIVNDNGNVSDVNLGDKAVEVAKFDMENNGDSDVMITQITLEDNEKNADEDLENFVLKYKGNTVATVAKASGKYVTFVLTTPVTIGENETEDFKVYADVIAGAGDDISFTIDQEIYVLGKDAKYGYGIATNVASYVAQTFSVLAGELTLVEKKLPNDLARADRDDFVLGSFELIPNAGKDLSLEDIRFVLNGSNLGGDTWDEVFENVELWVTVDGVTKRYDLNETSPSATAVTFSDTDLGVFLKSGKTTLVQLVADTVTTFPGTWTSPVKSFAVSMQTSTAGGFQVIENEDDETVNNIVPSSMTFDTVDLVTSTVVVTKLNLGNSVNVVKGAKNVDAFKFQVKPDQAGDVYVQSFDFDVDVAGCAVTPDADLLSAVKLWKWSTNASGAGSWEQLEQQGGFDLSAAGAISFDDFSEVEVLASKTQQFLLTVDVNDDDAVAGCSFDVNMTASDIEDDDNKDLTVTVPAVIGRTIVVTAAGSLDIKPELNDSKVNRAKHVLGGTTSDYVAAFDLVATNEGANIEDLELSVAGAGAADFENAITEVVIYNAAGTELYRESVSTTPVLFDNINFEIPQGTTTIFFKVVADLIGEGANGSEMDEVTVTLDALNVDGSESGDDITPTIGAGNSYAFDVVPVRISDLAFVTSYGGYSVITTYNSATTDSKLAILKVTTDTWANTAIATPDVLDLVLDTVNFTLPAGVTNVTLQRIDISNGTEENGPSVTYGTDDVNNTIAKGTTAYYLLRGDIATGAGTFTVQIEDLDGGTNFIYRADDGGYNAIDALYLGTSTLDNVVETQYKP